MTEAAFQKRLITACAKAGVPVQKFNDGFSHGIPDLYVGDFGWVELKIPGGKIKGSQIVWAKKFNNRSMPVVLLFSDGRVFDLAQCTPGTATKAWFEQNADAELDPGRLADAYHTFKILSSIPPSRTPRPPPR